MSNPKKLQLAILIFTTLFCFTVWYGTRNYEQFAGKVAGSGIYPNPAITPGVTNPAVTQANIMQTICTPGWTATIRPSSAYTTKLKLKQMMQYGYVTTDEKYLIANPSDFEEDHLISLELGGSPTASLNLWPQSYLTTPNARDKDKAEGYLHRQVCAGQITLKEAQREIATDWVKVYTSMPLGQFGSVEDISTSDD